MDKKSIFTVGGTVQAGKGRYVSREVDRALLDLCRSGTFAFVLSARQMGKSSLMVHTAEQLAEEGVHSLVVDLSQIGVSVSQDAWYLSLLIWAEDRLHLQTNALEWWEAHAHLSYAQRLTSFFEDVLLREIADPVVIFIDEIDSTLDLPFTDDFFAAIRYVYNARSGVPAFNRLSFVLIGVGTPNDLINDPRRTPFNIGVGVDVTNFSNEEAMRLADGFDLPQERARQAIKWILKWTGGHPYLTQKICAIVAERHSHEVSEADIEKAISSAFLSEKAGEDSNLRFVNDMLTRWAGDPVSVLTVYRRVLRGRPVADDKQSPVITHLKLAGVVRRQDGHLVLSSPIYGAVFDRAWVKRAWPEHWIKRVPPVVLGLVAALFVATIFLALFMIQTYRADLAQERAELQVDLNAQLRDQIAVADSLRKMSEFANEQLLTSARVSDSLRRETEAMNTRLFAEIKISDSLRSATESANRQLSDQARMADSLRSTAEDRLEEVAAARLETITIALANKAQRQFRLGDAQLGALLARQAYLFSQERYGEFLDPVYNALIEALNELAASGSATAGGPVVIQGLGGGIRAVAYSPDGKWLAAGNADGTTSLLDRETGLTKHIAAHEGSVRSLTFAPDAKLLATGGEDNLVKVWSNLDRKKNPRLEHTFSHTGIVWTTVFSHDGTVLASAGADRAVRIWALSEHGSGGNNSLPTNVQIKSMAFTPDGHRLLLGGVDGSLQILDWRQPETGPIAWMSDQGRVNALAIHPSGDLLATGGDLPPIRLWMLGDSQSAPKPFMSLQGHEGPVNSLAFSTDGSRLASASSDRSVQLWEVEHFDRSPILLQDHTDWVWAVAISPDQSHLASSGADRTVRIWNISLDQLSAKVCEAVGGRELSPGEWREYVGNDFRYEDRYEPCSAMAQNPSLQIR